jgi:hypothetical protein
MAHTFQIQHEIPNFSIEQIKAALIQPRFHENLWPRLPGTKVVVARSEAVDGVYYVERSLNLEADIPKVVKKMLSDALRVKRVEEWNSNTGVAELKFMLNLPAEFRCKSRVAEDNGRVMMKQDWEVDVNVPLIHGMLSRHAESEIRKFNQIEFDAFLANMADMYR